MRNINIPGEDLITNGEWEPNRRNGEKKKSMVKKDGEEG